MGWILPAALHPTFHKYPVQMPNQTCFSPSVKYGKHGACRLQTAKRYQPYAPVFWGPQSYRLWLYGLSGTPVLTFPWQNAASQPYTRALATHCLVLILYA